MKLLVLIALIRLSLWKQTVWSTFVEPHELKLKVYTSVTARLFDLKSTVLVYRGKIGKTVSFSKYLDLTVWHALSVNVEHESRVKPSLYWEYLTGESPSKQQHTYCTQVNGIKCNNTITSERKRIMEAEQSFLLTSSWWHTTMHTSSCNLVYVITALS